MTVDSSHRLALIGFGVVGQTLAAIIADKAADLKASHNLTFKIVAVATNSRGSLYHSEGLNIPTLLDVIKNAGHLNQYPDREGLIRDWDGQQIAANSNADTVIEVSYTNLQTGQPAIDYCRAALNAGKHVSTANKGPLALAAGELMALARQKGIGFGFESTVMAGTPAIRGGQLLQGNHISEISGILNGTTNYILTQMGEGATFADALAEAQRLGYAEADPSGDVDGHDAAAKVVILANVLMGANLSLSDVDTTGISHLTPDDIAAAQADGKRWKLLGKVTNQNGKVAGRVAPEMVSLSDPLAQVSQATNAITYHTDLIGPVTLVGAGAGGKETAAGILADILTMTAS